MLEKPCVVQEQCVVDVSASSVDAVESTPRLMLKLDMWYSSWCGP